jgi:hypothetical protein
VLVIGWRFAVIDLVHVVMSFMLHKDLNGHFNIDIETCEQCGGAVKVIASIDKSSGKTICTAMCLMNIHW